ncbi:hypothetical protein EIP91_004522 [Steccherinum ochraceum]|uniref:Uncharacterized protein n=1 Tax=Steccherinum ochraceum TaxID=92696 RepID=A0A4R0RH51_9APHY|nr:hypothetical protein EIP91_004522 [Steccherinum ochraceum]
MPPRPPKGKNAKPRTETFGPSSFIINSEVHVASNQHAPTDGWGRSKATATSSEGPAPPSIDVNQASQDLAEDPLENVHHDEEGRQGEETVSNSKKLEGGAAASTACTIPFFPITSYRT